MNKLTQKRDPPAVACWDYQMRGKEGSEKNGAAMADQFGGCDEDDIFLFDESGCGKGNDITQRVLSRIRLAYHESSPRNMTSSYSSPGEPMLYRHHSTPPG